MRKILKNIFLFIFVVFVLNLLVVGSAFAEFVDEEKTDGNFLETKTLDFSLSANDYSFLPLTPGISATRNASVANNGSLSFNYDVRVVKTGGDDNFCNVLNVEAKLAGLTQYSGSLLSFALPSSIVFSGGDNWDFTVKFDNNDASLQNKTCIFNFVFDGWQTDSDGTWGFVDEEILANTVTSGTWTATPVPASRVVINEVYYRGSSDAEWIEIYNAGTANEDLNGWTITDNNDTDTLISSSLILAPDSFAVVVGSNNNGQVIAGGAIKIILGNTAVGNGLADGGDRLILKDSLGMVIDQMSYGSDVAIWDPARTGVTNGHSLARSPKGFDTDSPSDFVDLDTPNPGTNPHPSTPAPSLEFSLSDDKKAVSFAVLHSGDYKKITYQIIYDSNNGDKGLVGSSDFTGDNTFSRSGLLLGTCSGVEGKVCVFDEGITKLHLKVTLEGLETVILEKEINY